MSVFLLPSVGICIHTSGLHLHRRDVRSPLQEAVLDRLPPDAQLYLAATSSSVLLSAGRDEEALFALERAQWALEALPEGAADAAVWHSCAGVALHALGDAFGAFEQCVRAMVMRQECEGLGPAHADTALATHNLACVLDGLGKQHRAKQLLVQAVQVGGSGVAQ